MRISPMPIARLERAQALPISNGSAGEFGRARAKWNCDFGDSKKSFCAEILYARDFRRKAEVEPNFFTGTPSLSRSEVRMGRRRVSQGFFESRRSGINPLGTRHGRLQGLMGVVFCERGLACQA